MSGATPSLPSISVGGYGDLTSGMGTQLTDYFGLTETRADVGAAEAAQEALDVQKQELEDARKKREEEIQKEIEKRNASRERTLSRGRGYGGTVLTSGLDSSTLTTKKKTLGVG